MQPLPYENQLIGVFIYALGRESGSSGQALPVNLFQQTPLDQRFGDLVVGAQWCVAIEFKRTRKGLAGEARKWSAVLERLPHILEPWKKIADRGHWVCYAQRCADGVSLLAEPYRAILAPRAAALAVDASELIRALAHNKIYQKHQRYGVPAHLLAAYLNSLAKVRLTGDGSDGDAGSASWLCAFGAGGQYRYVCAASLSELLEQLPPEHEQAHSHEAERSRLTQEPDLERD